MEVCKRICDGRGCGGCCGDHRDSGGELSYVTNLVHNVYGVRRTWVDSIRIHRVRKITTTNYLGLLIYFPFKEVSIYGIIEKSIGGRIKVWKLLIKR